MRSKISMHESEGGPENGSSSSCEDDNDRRQERCRCCDRIADAIKMRSRDECLRFCIEIKLTADSYNVLAMMA